MPQHSKGFRLAILHSVFGTSDDLRVRREVVSGFRVWDAKFRWVLGCGDWLWAFPPSGPELRRTLEDRGT